MKTTIAFLLTLALSTSLSTEAQSTIGSNAVPPGQTLTLAEAERLAIKNNPSVAIGRLLALAEGQVTRETRAAELPTVSGNLTAVDSRTGSRITAGELNNPVVYQRAAAGLSVNQLITDFGRTHNLVSSADLRAKAQASAALATSAEVILAVDQTFYRAQGTEEVLRVAQQTVAARQTVSEQVGALTGAKLKSSLDLSFADVNLSQAKLLLLDAQKANADALAELGALLGAEDMTAYDLVDETPAAPAPPPDDAEPLVIEAFQTRPDLTSLNQDFLAAKKFSAAEHDLAKPTLEALGTVGGAPVRSDQITSPFYGAVGINLNIPIFNGFLFSARAKEADLRASAAEQQVLELRQNIARDVRTTVLRAQSNFQRIEVTRQLLDQANSAFDLAQARYKFGLSSIVELSQAQLAQTEAQIDFATARFAYEGSLSVLRFQTGQ